MGAGGCGNSPILIDLGDGGFDLSGPDNPVQFDIDGNGTPETITWTAPGSRVAFLVLDRNGNGRVDSGRELFGNATLLTTGGTAKNGYIPLGEFDRPDMGGNGDGVISPEDQIWSQLRLWIDANHNGVSEPSELLTLDAAGLVAIGYDYTVSGRHDQYGNLFRYKGTAWRANRPGKPRAISTYDVFFQRVW